MVTEGAQKKRRWIWISVILLVLLAFGPSAWERYRPLTETERLLVGNWLELSDEDDVQAIHFRPDRNWSQTVFMADPRRPGFRTQIREQGGNTTWAAAGTTLTRSYSRPLFDDGLEGCLFSLAERISGGNSRRSEIVFSGSEQLSFDGKSYQRFDEKSPEVWRTPGAADDRTHGNPSGEAAGRASAP